ncbi:hypothetical protein CCM_02059 [Cordyceps militaris CM01]|uniref:Tat pathway signal sequence n=1 Tax=Cordyceps militaris (strain CM01) TaxID=983644 RepID=G3JCC5_CORMM|nr:uncharacterized protein CCM_02059 [Cordyceps militaris CM01]EGX93790.1 hypothetical protein CCM_02059 [Cordyceps militaris CM01]
MSRSFDKDSSARASSEFLIEHQARPQRPTRQPWSMRKAVFVTVCILVGSLELIVLETILVRWGEARGCPPALLSELNNLVPNFPTTPVLFRKDAFATVDHESEQSRNITRDNWLSYMPKGNGFIAVNDSAKYQLPDPIPFLGQSAYSIAVFHQLHCLYTIMDIYNDLTSERPAGHVDHHHHGREEASAHHHVDHCFRYLRQSLLCCGDTALEGQDPNTNKTGTDGTGAVHMCKDFETIRSWAEDHRLVNNKDALK